MDGPAAVKNGDEGDRTLNPRLAKAVLSQLSYVPEADAEDCTAAESILHNALSRTEEVTFERIATNPPAIRHR